MSARLRQRARIVRVRKVQHVQAAGAVAEAEARVASLENSAARLGDLRGVLIDGGGHGSGMALANAHELATRLDAARAGLTDAIVAARANAFSKDRQRIAARIAQEGAEKLRARAEADRAARSERRAAALVRPAADRGDAAWS
jgi:hypothetical protein